MRQGSFTLKVIVAESADMSFLSKLVTGYMIRSVPGETPREIVKLASDPDKRALDLVPLFLRNQSYEQHLQRLDLLGQRIADWKTENPNGTIERDVLCERIVALLGKSSIRNVALCIAFHKMNGALPRKAGDKFSLAPQDQLKHALEAEAFCQENGLAHADVAYQAGLHYDILRSLFTAQKLPKDAEATLAAAWLEGKKAARIAYDISRTFKSFKFERYAFAGTLLLPIGKALLSVAFPKEQGDRSWVTFQGEIDKIKFKKLDSLLALEPKRFPVGHAGMSSLFVSFIGLNRPIEKALAYYPTPYYLKKTDTDLARLAQVFHLSLALSQTDFMKGNLTELPLNPAQKSWFRELGMNETHVLTILNAMAAKERKEKT